MKVYVDGTLFSPEDATVSLFDDAFYGGMGLRATVICQENKFFQLKETIDGLKKAAEDLVFDFAWDENAVKEAICATYESNVDSEKTPPFSLEVLLTPGFNSRTEAIEPTRRPENFLDLRTHAIAETAEAEKNKPIPPEVYSKSQIIVLPRPLPDPLNMLAEGCNCCSSEKAHFLSAATSFRRERFHLAKKETALGHRLAKTLKADEMIAFDENGLYGGSSAGELMGFKDRILVMSPGCDGLKAIFKKILDGSPVVLRAKDLTRQDIEGFSEIFLFGSDWFFRPVLSFDGEKVGEGTVGKGTEEVSKRFAKHMIENLQPPF